MMPAFVSLARSAALVPLTLCVLLAATSCRDNPPPPPETAEVSPPEPVAPEPAPPPEPEPEPEPEPPPPAILFSLPTDNDALFRGDGPAFYMFVDRAGEQVWQAGGYGFVRNPRETQEGKVFTKFHEGVDIAPVRRDARGEPLDLVKAIADGTVVYATKSAGVSNYGNYVVVAHDCGEGEGVFYSLYAHLKRIDTKPGEDVRRGDVIGLMGYTGAGIDRRRAHVHLELCFLLSERFEEYYATRYKLANGHGIYHGTNLLGLDVASFLLENHKNPRLMPSAFLRSREPYFKVTVPNRGGELEIVERYPWLRQPGEPDVSWELSFDGAGVPLAVAPSGKAAPFPSVTWVKPFSGYHTWNTRGLLGGSGNTATLTSDGARFIQLVTGDFGAPTGAKGK